MRADSNTSFDGSEEPSEKVGSKLGIKKVVSQQSAHVTIYLTSEGKVFGGGNRSSVLIPESSQTNQRKPVFIPMPIPGIFIEGVAVGPSHVLTWDANGNAYGWGHNKYGCIGVRDNNLRSFEVVKSPEVVHSFRCGKIVCCYIVDKASFAVTYQGKIYYWGK